MLRPVTSHFLQPRLFTPTAASFLVICLLSLSACSPADNELRVYPLNYQQMDPEAMEVILNSVPACV